MTTEEYMNKKEQEELDKYWDDYYKSKSEQIRKEQEAKDRKELEVSYITTLADCEAELDILEEMLKTKMFGRLEDREKITVSTDSLKKDIIKLKRKQSKTKTLLNTLIKEEQVEV